MIKFHAKCVIAGDAVNRLRAPKNTSSLKIGRKMLIMVLLYIKLSGSLGQRNGITQFLVAATTIY